MSSPTEISSALHSAAQMPASVKAALPELTVLIVNGALNVLLALVILLAGWVLSRWLAERIGRALDHTRHIDDTLKPLLAKSARYSILAITIVAVLQQFGVQTTSVIALLGAAGLAIGLALQGTLSNVASGTMLLILRPFRIGDYVVVGADIGGKVREINMFRTVLITPDMLYISVPNSQVFGSAITNYTREDTRRINIIVGIDYEDDIDKAQAVLLDILKNEPRILENPAPIAPVNELGASSVNLIARGYVANADYWEAYFAIQKAIKLRFDEEGISIPFPQQVQSQRPEKTASKA
jgi:small conductance mechanosensitive channel